MVVERVVVGAVVRAELDEGTAGGSPCFRGDDDAKPDKFDPADT